MCWSVLLQSTKLYFPRENTLPVTGLADNPTRDSFCEPHQRFSAHYYHSIDYAELGTYLKGTETLVFHFSLWFFFQIFFSHRMYYVHGDILHRIARYILPSSSTLFNEGVQQLVWRRGDYYTCRAMKGKWHLFTWSQRVSVFRVRDLIVLLAFQHPMTNVLQFIAKLSQFPHI